MSTLTETDHARLRHAERTWLLQSADRLRRAATERRNAAVTHPVPTEEPPR